MQHEIDGHVVEASRVIEELGIYYGTDDVYEIIRRASDSYRGPNQLIEETEAMYARGCLAADPQVPYFMLAAWSELPTFSVVRWYNGKPCRPLIEG